VIGGRASLTAITDKEVSVIIASPMAMTIRNGFTFAAARSRRRISFDPLRMAGVIDSPLWRAACFEAEVPTGMR
jgi:hypothetical protein